MTRGRLHIIGAGLAGLAAAVRASAQGWRITLHEASNHAGGRARSYLDKELGCRIDNGNHLLLSANRDALNYITTIGAMDTLSSPDEPIMPFLDMQTMERWSLRPNSGRIPWWVFAPGRRVPGTGPLDYLAPLRLQNLTADHVVTDGLDITSRLYRRLWEPFAVAALNTKPNEASARLLWNVMQESFAQGGDALFPLIPKQGLSESLVDPALAYLTERGVEFRFGHRLRRVESHNENISTLIFSDEEIAIHPDDRIILAVPAQGVSSLGLEIDTPQNFRAIVNAHFRFPFVAKTPGILGLVGGFTEWIFIKPGIISTTNSAAEDIVDSDAGDLAQKIWSDIQRALHLENTALPPWRVVKEKRATFAATPEEERRRPGPITKWRNLILAGDWTATGLPATLEGAIRSGHAGAAVLSL